VCRGEEPGTVFRTTDTHDEWLLGDDQEWHRHVAAFPTGSATALGEQAQS